MKKYEYASFNRGLKDSDLNVLGEEGWELIIHTLAVNPITERAVQYYVFKKEYEIERPLLPKLHFQVKDENKKNMNEPWYKFW